MFGVPTAPAKEATSSLQAIRTRLAQRQRESSGSRGSVEQGPKSGSMVYKQNGTTWQAKATNSNFLSAKKESIVAQSTPNGGSQSGAERWQGLIRSVYTVHRSVSKQSQGEETNPLGFKPATSKNVETVLGERKASNFSKIRSLEALAANKAAGKSESEAKSKATPSSTLTKSYLPLALSNKAASTDKQFRRMPDSGAQTDRLLQPTESETDRPPTEGR